MNLSLLHGEIALIGLGAASIPIIVHLLLRQRPRHVVFPAMQLLRKKQTQTVRKLRLRHLLLLALRTAMILLLAFALARPTLHSSLFSIDQEEPVSVMLLVDTSLSMQYKEKGKTRLDLAKELARQVVERLPDGSDITIFDTASPSTSVPLDVPTALSRLNTLELDVSPRVINEALELAYRGLKKSEKGRREIYILSDLASSSWNLAGSTQAQESTDQAVKAIRVYVINVGVEKPENISLSEPQLSQQVVPANGDVKVSLSVRNIGPDVDRAVELSLDGEPRDNRAVRLPSGQATEISFTLANLREGFHQGRATINAGDGMPFDDVRFFTIEVRPPVKVLIAADQPGDAAYWANALVPADLQRQNRARYQLDVIPSARLAETNLSGYGVVSLINVGSLSQEAWLKLSNFVQSGGGLFVALGERVDRFSYNSQAAQAVLPVKLGDEVKGQSGIVLAPERFIHPLLVRFRDWGTGELSDLPVMHYFKADLSGGNAQTVIPYSNGDPGLVERSFGQGKRGRSLLLTTAAHYRPGGDAWTEFPLGWSYVALADQIVRYLSGVAETQLNFPAGQPVSMELDPGHPTGLYSITDPNNQIERIAADGTENSLTIPPGKVLGNYRVDSTGTSATSTRGFSLNEPVEESILTPVDVERLREMIGKEQFSIARDPANLEQIVGEGRVGRELFPWLMLLVLAAVTAESYVANRFYRAPQTVPA